MLGLNSQFKIPVIYKSTRGKENLHLDIVVATLHGIVVWNEELLSPLVHADNTRSLVVWKGNRSVS